MKFLKSLNTYVNPRYLKYLFIQWNCFTVDEFGSFVITDFHILLAVTKLRLSIQSSALDFFYTGFLDMCFPFLNYWFLSFNWINHFWK